MGGGGRPELSRWGLGEGCDPREAPRPAPPSQAPVAPPVAGRERGSSGAPSSSSSAAKSPRRPGGWQGRRESLCPRPPRPRPAPLRTPPGGEGAGRGAERRRGEPGCGDSGQGSAEDGGGGGGGSWPPGGQHGLGRGADQFDTIERHTQWGLDLVDKYVKFVKERTEIEQTYAKQLRNLVKKHLPKRTSREDPESKFCQYQAFLQVVRELNDFAGQREVVAENLLTRICVELARYSQELKQERKSNLQEGRRAQQQLENSFKQLENSKRKFERDCREAEKAVLTAEKLDQDINATKADVEKAKLQANLRSHMAEESKNEYASCLQKFNRNQSQFYFLEMPQIFSKLQEMDERRVQRLKEGYGIFSETEEQVVPIIGKCLEGMKAAADLVDEKHDSQMLIELHKSGFERPGDLEFEDFSQPMNRTSSDSSLGTPRGTLDGRLDPRLLSKNKTRRWPFGRKNKAVMTEDFSHLPPEQRRKKLQQKIAEGNRQLQKELDQRDALNKMKDVYQKTPQMGDPSSLEPKISETLANIERLHGEIQKYEAWLADAEGRMLNNRPETVTRYNRHVDHASTLNNNNCSHEKDRCLTGLKLRSAPSDQHGCPLGNNSHTTPKVGTRYIKARRSPGATSPETTTPEENQDTLNQPIYTEFDEDFEEDPASPVGTCVALYHFEGSSEGTISLQEGEELSLMEEDKGDGWTRVRRSQGGEGYVPTSYLRVSLN
ncbi:cdc42-interacting protein 4 isoform X3 [Paroedura picta]|uniref:cdc42-interacting protein 4 isoform X3 n=1 Tax=Paroedura picta TaxID=143630 RepID=UPI0040579358